MRSSGSPAGGTTDCAGLVPGHPIEGEHVRMAPSKSHAIRALLCAGMARGVTRLSGFAAGHPSEDLEATIELLMGCGVEVEPIGEGVLSVTGRGPGEFSGRPARLIPDRVLSCGESGTLARLATALLSLHGRPQVIEVGARGSLLDRASAPLFTSLARYGVGVEFRGMEAGWPVRLTPRARPRDPSHVLDLEEPVSSQEVSALLAALACGVEPAGLRVFGRIPSRPYLELTTRVLEGFGARVISAPELVPPGAVGASCEAFWVWGPLCAPSREVRIEPDASAAAVLLAAACLSRGAVDVAGLGPESAQGDVRVLEHLERFGCVRRDGFSSPGFPTRGAEVDLAGEPDLAPVLAPVAAAVALQGSPDAPVPSTSRLLGLWTLRSKESDRLAGLARGIAALGLTVTEGEDFLQIAPGAPVKGELVLDPEGDHRMAFAFALLGLLREGILVRDAVCVAKSWPRFWRDLESLGAKVSRRELPDRPTQR